MSQQETVSLPIDVLLELPPAAFLRALDPQAVRDLIKACLDDDQTTLADLVPRQAPSREDLEAKIVALLSAEKRAMNQLEIANALGADYGQTRRAIDALVASKRAEWRAAGLELMISKLKLAAKPKAKTASPKPKVTEATVVGVMTAAKRRMTRWDVADAIPGSNIDHIGRLLSKLEASGRAKKEGLGGYVLVGLGAPKTPKATKAASRPPAPPAAKPRAARQPLDAADLERFYTQVTEVPNGAAAIGAATGLDSNIVGRCLAQLMVTNRIEKIGKGPGTKYRRVLAAAPASKPNGAGAKQPGLFGGEAQASAEA